MQFLPDNLMKTLDSSNANHNYVLSKQELLAIRQPSTGKSSFTPILFFSLLLAAIVVISLLKNGFAKAFIQGFDGILFFLTGLTGILLIFMWTATDHQMCKYNFNLLWALPTHLIIAFFVNSKKQWVKKYFGLTALLMTALLLAWFFLPQTMNNALIPVVLLFLYRSIVKYRSAKY
jgi:hypothetical protein